MFLKYYFKTLYLLVLGVQFVQTNWKHKYDVFELAASLAGKVKEI